MVAFLKFINCGAIHVLRSFSTMKASLRLLQLPSFSLLAKPLVGHGKQKNTFCRSQWRRN